VEAAATGDWVVGKAQRQHGELDLEDEPELHKPGGPGHPEIGRPPQAGYFLDYRKNFSRWAWTAKSFVTFFVEKVSHGSVLYLLGVIYLYAEFFHTSCSTLSVKRMP
jgi:hypothetical protein